MVVRRRGKRAVVLHYGRGAKFAFEGVPGLRVEDNHRPVRGLLIEGHRSLDRKDGQTFRAIVPTPEARGEDQWHDPQRANHDEPFGERLRVNHQINPVASAMIARPTDAMTARIDPVNDERLSPSEIETSGA